MRRLGFVSASLLFVAACGGAQSEPSISAKPPKEAGGEKAAQTKREAPRWVAPDNAKWIEREPSGADRILLGGRRAVVRGSEVLGIASAAEDISGARVSPSWAAKAGAPQRYVFWTEKEVFGAAEWLGEAKLLGKLPSTVQATFDWFDGAGLLTDAGAFVVRPDGGGLVKLDIPGLGATFAADEKRALVLTVFGHARLTLDGGKTYRDVTAELPEATDVEAHEGKLHVLFAGEESRFIDASGAITPTSGPGTRLHDEPPPDLDDRWENEFESPLEAAATRGILLDDGDALTTTGLKSARVDLRTGRATALMPLGGDEGACEPLHSKEGPLLVCEAPGHVSVLDMANGGRIERSFDVLESSPLDRFVVVDGEALGFVGGCDGRPIPLPADVIMTDAPTNASNQRSPVFCVRQSPSVWVEHKVDDADASDVIAWIPRPEGAAIALVGIPGSFVSDVPRVSVRGSLRVVRVARTEPPIDINSYSSESRQLLSRSLRALPDGTIEGWLSSAHGPSGLSSISIDPSGRATQRPLPPRTTSVTTAGRFALARTEDDRTFETTDYGKTFRPIAPPPGGVSNSEPLSCTEVGCRVGAFIRLGWGEPEGAALPNASKPPPEYQRPLPAPPLVRLACRFTGPGETKRASESFGLGYSSTPTPRMSPSRISLSGAMFVPWQGGQLSLGSDADIAYLPPFDLAAPIIRKTVPLSRLGPNPFHPFEVHLGYLLDGASVRPFVTTTYGRCAAPLIDESGLTLPIGGCADDPSMGVVVGNRALFVHKFSRFFEVSSMAMAPDGRREGSPKGKPVVTPGARREISSFVGADDLGRFTLATGLRQKGPVVIAVDAGGSAVLAPIDPDLGRFGAEEALAPLSTLALGSEASCASKPDDARVVFAFDTEIGLVPGALQGVSASGNAGLAVLRWSSSRVCVDAIEIAVRDERYETDLGYYDPPGTVRKLIARFDGKDKSAGVLAVMTYGTEVRQPLVCEGVAR